MFNIILISSFVFQVAEWATRAFFKYGVESSGVSTGLHAPATSTGPALGSPAPGGSLTGSPISSPGVRPGFGSPGLVTSTPHGGMGQAVTVRPEQMRSSKHDGLCLYFARILEYVFSM